MGGELKAARDAIASGSVEALAAEAAGDAELAKDWRLIMDAALHRDAEAIRILLAAGADPNAVSKSEARHRPLHRAIEPKPSVKRRGPLLGALDALLDAGADPDAAGCWYEGTALETAARAADRTTADHLIRRGARRDLVTAVLMGDEPLLDAELRRDPNAAKRRDAGGAEPLHRLCASKLNRHAAASMVRTLIAAGASATARTEMKHGTFPVMHFACFGGEADAELLNVLVSAGAKPDDGLYEALWSGDLAGAGTLISLGASPDSWSHVSDRPMLSEMIQWGRYPAALWLLKHGADPNQPDRSGRAALQVAQARGAPGNVVDALVAAGGQ